MSPSADVTFTIVDPASPVARELLTRYFDELAARFEGGFDPGDAYDEADTTLIAPNGVFVVATLADDPMGCGGVVFMDEHRGEIKRMWISPSSRGLGLGKRLLAHLEDLAASAGRTRVVLDTNSSLTQAIAMYESAGYAPIERYNDNPYAQRWFEKHLPDR